jgi:ribosome biogenesis SPOUT family RNA methylase Rps3
VIEHLENHFSKWIRAEYQHAKNIAGERLVITNLGRYLTEARRHGLCDETCSCFRESVLELRKVLYSDPGHVIILDPFAEKVLEPAEAAKAEAIVIGGILGDHPPRARTRKLLTSRAPAMQSRSLGPYQLSIDGTVYVALRVIEGTNPFNVPLVQRPRIIVNLGLVEVEIELPFSYPVIDGKPLISREVIELLARGLGLEEYRELNRE